MEGGRVRTKQGVSRREGKGRPNGKTEERRDFFFFFGGAWKGGRGIGSDEE